MKNRVLDSIMNAVSEKSIAVAMAVVALALVTYGCGKRGSPEADAAIEERNQRLDAYVAADDQMDAQAWSWLKEQAYKLIDQAHAMDTKELQIAVDNKLDSESKSADGLTLIENKSILMSAIKRQSEFDSERLKQREKVDKALAQLANTKRMNKINLAVASDLDMLIQRFNNAGVDLPAAAKRSLDVLRQVLQMNGLTNRAGTPLPNLTGAGTTTTP